MKITSIALMVTIIGTVLGFILGIAIEAKILKESNTYRLGVVANKMLDQCEIELPRNQNCTIEAIPSVNSLTQVKVQ